MKKSKVLANKIRDIKGIFHARMDRIKDRNSKDLIEAEEIKKRWQEYTELYKKGLNDPDNHDGVVTHLTHSHSAARHPALWNKWALGSITMDKVSGSNGVSAELFKFLKDDAIKVLNSVGQQIWKMQQCPQDWERSVFIPVPKKNNATEWSNYCSIALISHASKVMLKILQARVQQYMNQGLPGVKAEFQRDRGTRDQIANICWIMDKAREYLLLLHWPHWSLYRSQHTVENS